MKGILEGMEKRYGKGSVCANFHQTAVLSNMGITDKAEGSVCFKYPDKMFWHYKTPEEQFVVSNGKTLWIYRTLDNQVMVGDATELFGAGDGSSFLSDISLLDKKFRISLAKGNRWDLWRDKGYDVLKLVPLTPRPEFVNLYLIVDKKTCDIKMSASYNEFGDATKIEFTELDRETSVPDSKFGFEIPEKAEVIPLDEN